MAEVGFGMCRSVQEPDGERKIAVPEHSGVVPPVLAGLYLLPDSHSEKTA